MKRIILQLSTTIFLISTMGCSDQNDHYLDLETGRHITVVKDSANGEMINKETRQPVRIYVDTETKDTIYGKTGEVINNKVKKTADGKYIYEVTDNNPQVTGEHEGDYKIKEGDYKKKVGNDGDVKIKDGDEKIKIDGKTGEKKVKKS